MLLSRRDFFFQSLIVGAAFGVGPDASMADASKSITASKPLNILLFGGGGFMGPHFARAAMDRGHRVSVFGRGKTNANLPRDVEYLVGDRQNDLESIKGRDWDTVVDFIGYTPDSVSALGRAIGDRIKHYTFISSVSAYDTRGANGKMQEDGKLLDYRGVSKLNEYGALKALCEREVQSQFPGRNFILRPSVIVGPGGEHGIVGLTYWIARMREGGEILAPGDPLRPVQFIDVRDLALWAILSVERAETGVYNVVGPAMDMGWGELLGAIRGTLSTPMKLTWVPVPWLMDQGIKASDITLFWPMEEFKPGLMSMDNARARAKGLTFRALHETVRDTLAWHEAQPPAVRDASLFGQHGALRSIADAVARDREILTAWNREKPRDLSCS